MNLFTFMGEYLKCLEIRAEIEGGEIVSKVYGCSDDIVVIMDDDGTCNEIDCNFSYVEAVVIGFEDGTGIRIGYGKNGKGIWWTEIIEKGDASYTLKECDDENAEIYSDVFEIESLAVGWGYDYK